MCRVRLPLWRTLGRFSPNIYQMQKVRVRATNAEYGGSRRETHPLWGCLVDTIDMIPLLTPFA